jgi:tetratricopeptide (TPR) repeat protein
LEEMIVESNNSRNKIAIIDVEGLISSEPWDRSGRSMVELIADELKVAAEDEAVRAVILKVDSPGGEVLASDDISRAIAEFQDAAHDPRRKIDCISLQGVCCRDKGDFARAEDILTRGIALKGLTAEQLTQLKYELALLYETMGRHDDALSLFREIKAIHPDFRDTSEKTAGVGTEATQEYDELDLVELEEGENE